jgi:predicted SnoaL-like aldol condensation-catalyzing enzyme
MVHYCGERGGHAVVASVISYSSSPTPFGEVPAGIYDLYRIENGKIAEHWDALESQFHLVPNRRTAMASFSWL